MLSLFPDEKILTQSNGGVVTLTTHRICYESEEWGRSYNQNIMLEHITSSENYSSSQVWLLISAGICIVYAIISAQNRESQYIVPAIVIAVIFGIIYNSTKRNFVIISSPSTKMKIPVEGMKRDAVLGFINKIEQAKNNRVNSLNARPNIFS
jgi:hypothetical protein